VTTILVTHDQDEAYELADRIGVLDRGVLLDVGVPEQLYSKPRALQLASFLGAGNVISGRVVNGQARLGSLVFPLPADSPREEGASVEVLFRPEQVALSVEEPASGPVLGKGTVVEQTSLAPCDDYGCGFHGFLPPDRWCRLHHLVRRDCWLMRW
jgi:ABC-type Fe3+/spermidine/putrescine transport system ATPase subunit